MVRLRRAGEKKTVTYTGNVFGLGGILCRSSSYFFFYLIIITRGGGDECAADARRLYYTTSRYESAV